jgi:SAM-dependent methyltransferase
MQEFVTGWLRRLVKATSGGSTGPNITRYMMYQRLAEIDLEPAPGATTLSISHSVNVCGMLGLGGTSIVEANYPEVNMLSLPFDDAFFDFVVSDQVLEHVEGNPFTAVGETLRVLKPGGVVAHSTCLLLPIHSDPSDFWRYTPDGLRLLVKDEADVIVADSWGNRSFLAVEALGLRYLPVPHSPRHPLHRLAVRDDRSAPVVTWVIARKR